MAEETDDDLPGDETPPKKPAAKPKPKSTPEPAPQEPAPKKHVHTQRLVNIAAEMGFSQADLDNHPSDVIWEEIHRLNTLAAEQEKARSAPAPAPKVEVPVDEEEAFLAEMEANAEIDPRYVKKLKKDRERLKALEEKAARIDQLEAAEKARTGRQQTEMLDTAFALLGKRFEALVGTDSLSDLTDPGQKGWRTEIYRKAKVDFAKDSQRAINKKILDAAVALAGARVEEEPETNEYDRKPVRKKDPETGRFTSEDFDRAVTMRPSAKRPAIPEISGVEALRQHFAANGDPRGSRNYTDPDDTDDLPG